MAANIWFLDESKFLCKQEVQQLMYTARANVRESRGRAHRTAVQDYYIVDLGLSTGLRVAEMAQLTCGDVYIGIDSSSLVVRNGKGGKPRVVKFNGRFTKHHLQFLHWKEHRGESVLPNAPLLLSATTGIALTRRALQKAVKRITSLAGLSPRYSIHSLRHTYACFLYKASGYNLRLVQKQLGHSNITTTQIYADVMMPDLSRALNRLYT